ncbi:MAG TPA: tetratricopeptide repeat protein [Saprospiraceae bacterium]|nr:tetratricopeptide repeat protein [Saprospiraceae bacterium]
MSKKKTPPQSPKQPQRPEKPEESSVAESTPVSGGFQFEPAWLWAVVLTVVTVMAYYLSLDNGFMVFDDDKAIRYNNLIKNPTFRGLFMANNLGMYAPITWCGYALVYALAGESASAFHTFSLLLHIGCVLSVFTLMRMLQSRAEVAFFTALLFALHPMQVEATSWIAGQSALTFSLFYLLSLMAYVQWQNSQRALFFGLSIVAFLLSVLSKSAAVTLPVLLLALDWYKNGTVTLKNVLAKAPYFVVSLIFGLYTFSTREAEGHDLVVSSSAYNLFDRFLMVCHSLLFYPVKLLLPFKLSIFYPMQKTDGVWSIDYYLAPLALAAIGWAAWKYGRRDRVIGLAALWYLIPLAVMLPYVSVGTFEMRSDRYVYISSVGFFLLLVYLAQRIPAEIRRGALIGMALLFGFLTLERSQVWNNEVSVFRDCVDKYPDAPLCNCNLAYGELLNLEFEPSVQHYTKALALDPSYVEAYNGRGQAYFQLKKFPEAFSDFDNAIKAGIVTPKLFLNRGKCHVILSRPAEAIPDLAKSLELEPRNPETWYFKAVAEGKTGDLAGALKDYSKAIELNPQYVEALVNRGLMYFNEQKFDEAIADYTAALAVRPDIIIARNNRAMAYLSKGMLNEALADVNKSIEAQSNYPKSYETRAKVYTLMGKTAEAAKDLEKVKTLTSGG